MSYFHKRRGALGDGPVTSPTQVDDTIIVGSVGPSRVDCSTLPADSPWRNPGQACAGAPLPGPATGLTNLLDYMTGLLSPLKSLVPGGTATPAAPDGGSSTSTLLLLAGAGGLAYYLMTKKKGP